MTPQDLFNANLALVDRVIATVSRRAGLRDSDAEDFASIAKLELIENDYAILRGYEGRAPLGAYLTVIVQRILTRERLRIWGRWHPSAEAARLGPSAVLLEKLIVYDKRTLEEAVPIVCASDPSLDRIHVRELAGRLPRRVGRPRLVPLDEDVHEVAASDAADAHAQEMEARRMSGLASQAVRDTMAALPLQDRMLLKFHFGAGLSLAETSRLLGVPQRPLYRRVEALLRQLRHALEREGIGASAVEDMINTGVSESADFGLRDGKMRMPVIPLE